MNAVLETLPVKLEKLARVASYGSWFQFYLCGIDIVAGPGQSASLNLPPACRRSISRFTPTRPRDALKTV